jgi:hypothetical protein
MAGGALAIRVPRRERSAACAFQLLAAVLTTPRSEPFLNALWKVV